MFYVLCEWGIIACLMWDPPNWRPTSRSPWVTKFSINRTIFYIFYFPAKFFLLARAGEGGWVTPHAFWSYCGWRGRTSTVKRWLRKRDLNGRDWSNPPRPHWTRKARLTALPSFSRWQSFLIGGSVPEVVFWLSSPGPTSYAGQKAGPS